uniref:Uncharacterized protein n=1 Tax=Arundo donax TaxID=35708 RepID=A0A0A9HDH0_ARUDO
MLGMLSNTCFQLFYLLMYFSSLCLFHLHKSPTVHEQ